MDSIMFLLYFFLVLLSSYAILHQCNLCFISLIAWLVWRQFSSTIHLISWQLFFFSIINYVFTCVCNWFARFCEPFFSAPFSSTYKRCWHYLSSGPLKLQPMCSISFQQIGPTFLDISLLFCDFQVFVARYVGMLKLDFR